MAVCFDTESGFARGHSMQAQCPYSFETFSSSKPTTSDGTGLGTFHQINYTLKRNVHVVQATLRRFRSNTKCSASLKDDGEGGCY